MCDGADEGVGVVVVDGGGGEQLLIDSNRVDGVGRCRHSRSRKLRVRRKVVSCRGRSCRLPLGCRSQVAPTCQLPGLAAQ